MMGKIINKRIASWSTWQQNVLLLLFNERRIIWEYSYVVKLFFKQFIYEYAYIFIPKHWKFSVLNSL